MADIASMLGLQAPTMSTGSTEPRAIFTMANQQLGLGLDETLAKPDLARGIVEATGAKWLPEYESRGSTVTAAGLEAVALAVGALTEL